MTAIAHKMSALTVARHAEESSSTRTGGGGEAGGLRWRRHRKRWNPRCFCFCRLLCIRQICRETFQARFVYHRNRTLLSRRIGFHRCRGNTFCSEARQCRGKRRLAHPFVALGYKNYKSVVCHLMTHLRSDTHSFTRVQRHAHLPLLFCVGAASLTVRGQILSRHMLPQTRSMN